MHERLIDADATEADDIHTEEIVAALFRIAFPELVRRREFQPKGRTMFNLLKMLRALLPGPLRKPMPAVAFTGHAPASATPGYDGSVRKHLLPADLGERKFYLAPPDPSAR